MHEPVTASSCLSSAQTTKSSVQKWLSHIHSYSYFAVVTNTEALKADDARITTIVLWGNSEDYFIVGKWVCKLKIAVVDKDFPQGACNFNISSFSSLLHIYNSISRKVCKFSSFLCFLFHFPWWRFKGFQPHEILNLINYFLQWSWVLHISSLGLPVFVHFISKTPYLGKFADFHCSFAFIFHFSTVKIQWVLSPYKLKFDQEFFPLGLSLQYLFLGFIDFTSKIPRL